MYMHVCDGVDSSDRFYNNLYNLKNLEDLQFLV